jgi:ABC-type multidrug transport system ATPase subunit
VPGGKIELVALTKRFAGVAVDSIDLTVSSGEFFSLPGRRAAARPPHCAW